MAYVKDWTKFYDFKPVQGVDYRFDYMQIAEDLNTFKLENDINGAALLVRTMARADLFFLIYFVLGVQAVNHPFLVKRIYETQDGMDRTVNLWSRGHFKSTIITYAYIIWIMLNEPEARIGIFSHTRNIALSFLRRIKITLETNAMLKMAFPEILYMNPEKESPKWSENEGITIKRRGSYNECSLEAWGVVENMPTGRHFTHLIFDDLVTVDSVTTLEQMDKVEEGFKTALNLVADEYMLIIIGTHYHYNDLYVKLRNSSGWNVRIYPATHNGKRDGDPVYWTKENLDQKFSDMGSYIGSCQLLLTPVTEEEQKFKSDWLKFYSALPEKLHHYLIVDPAGERKDTAGDQDFSVIVHLATDMYKNIYLVDIIRDRIGLSERWNIIAAKSRETLFKTLGYEKYGMQNDTTYIKEKQYEEGLHFPITELSGVTISKNDRIKRLIPVIESGHFWLPYSLPKKMVNGKTVDMIETLIREEYNTFPYSAHDDMMDAISRIRDEKMNVTYPFNSQKFAAPTKTYNPLDDDEDSVDWRDM